MNKVLIVVDMQNDFVTGSLGSKEAIKIVPNVVNKVESYIKNNNPIIFTRDTHNEDYLETLEGEKLPVEHCIYDTDGWKIIPELEDLAKSYKFSWVLNKSTFGYRLWNQKLYSNDEVELIGLCTDICVVSNALAIRMFFPDMKITVDASCCAGSTPEKHKAALEVMKSCQIDVIGE